MYVVLGEYHFEYVLSPLILTLFMIPFWLSRFIFLSNPIDSLLLIKISYLPIRISSCEVPVHVPVSSSPRITSSLIPDRDKDPPDDLTKWAKIDCDDHSLNWTSPRLSFVRT